MYTTCIVSIAKVRSFRYSLYITKQCPVPTNVMLITKHTDSKQKSVSHFVQRMVLDVLILLFIC